MEEEKSTTNNVIDTLKDQIKDTKRLFYEHNVLPEWSNYSAVSKFKSVRRAIRRGHVDLIFGFIYPSRPFNNRKPTLGRHHNQTKKDLYDKFK